MIRTLVAALAFAAALIAHPAHADHVWTETWDAGDLPAAAQWTKGVGPLDAIAGTIASPRDRDMFRIVIDDPASFSASLNNAGTQLSFDSDLQLFLFDAAGIGVLANDDDPSDRFGSLKSAIPRGSFTGPAGLYYIALGIYDSIPISAGGAIFPATPHDGIVGPTGPGGSAPISGWQSYPDPAQTGYYRLALTGARFGAAVPEPASLGMLGAGGLSLLGLACRRRATT